MARPGRARAQGRRRGRWRLAGRGGDRARCHQPQRRAHAGRDALRRLPDGARGPLRRPAPDLRSRRLAAERSGARGQDRRPPDPPQKGPDLDGEGRRPGIVTGGSRSLSCDISPAPTDRPMDNLTHSLVGALLGQMGLKRRTGLAMPTLILAANLPDIDAGCALYGIESLAMRRGLTHGPIALLVLPLLLWAAMLAFDRWQARRGTRPAARLPIHKGWLLALACLGCLSHPAFDWLNTYGVRDRKSTRLNPSHQCASRMP